MLPLIFTDCGNDTANLTSTKPKCYFLSEAKNRMETSINIELHYVSVASI